jgi:hypothetical protein
MSSGNQFERVFKLWASVSKLVVDRKRRVEAVANLLQSVIDDPGYVLYLAPDQKNGGTMTGFEVVRDLIANNLVSRFQSLESPLVKSWLENPVTYPEEFKGRAIFIWGSQRIYGGRPSVAYLIWDDIRVVADWYRLEGVWRDNDPALLKSFLIP